jgi:hypothetical protein
MSEVEEAWSPIKLGNEETTQINQHNVKLGRVSRQLRLTKNRGLLMRVMGQLSKDEALTLAEQMEEPDIRDMLVEYTLENSESTEKGAFVTQTGRIVPLTPEGKGGKVAGVRKSDLTPSYRPFTYQLRCNETGHNNG